MVESILQTSLPQIVYSIFQIKSKREYYFIEIYGIISFKIPAMRIQADTDRADKNKCQLLSSFIFWRIFFFSNGKN